MYELYYLKGSPWSFKTMWPLALMPQEVRDSLALKPTLMANSLASKLAAFQKKHKLSDEDKQPISLPMFFHASDTKEGSSEESPFVFRNGYDIVAYLAPKGQNDFCQVFKRNEDAMKKWNDQVLQMMRFVRGQMSAKDHGDNLGQYLLPAFLSYIPGFLRIVNYFTGNTLKGKYFAIDSAIPLEEVEKTLQEANTILKDHPFLVDDQFSYADAVLCAFAEFASPSKFDRPVTFGALAPNTVKYLRREFDWETKFPKVFDLRDRAFKEFLTEDAVKICEIKLTKKLNFPEAKM